LFLLDVPSLTLRFVIFSATLGFTVISHFFSVISQRPLRLLRLVFLRFSQLTAMPRTRAGEGWHLGKNSCFAPLQSRAGPASYTDNIFALASIRAMVALIFSGLPFSVKKIGNRGPAQHNRFPQNVLQHAAQCVRLFSAQIGSQPRWMNLRFPQALIRIDIANAAEKRSGPAAAP